LSVYRLSLPYERTPTQRRASGLALALGVNLLLLLVLWGLGVVTPDKRPSSSAITVDLVPESHSASSTETSKAVARQTQTAASRPTPKPPPIILPAKPTITARTERSQPWIEMSHDELASADLRNIASSGDGSAGDSEVVGRGPHGELLYGVEWARLPTNAELSGYLPRNAPDGWGEIACKTIPDNRVDDCFEIGQEPAGSHLASAVRQAAWQFHIRPPRKGGKPLIGVWILVHIDYDSARSEAGGL
jgi:protein TonB